MTTLTVRGPDDDTRARPRVRAARDGRSMGAEVRAILRDAVAEPDGHTGPGGRIAARSAAVGGVDLEASRGAMPRTAHLDA